MTDSSRATARASSLEDSRNQFLQGLDKRMSDLTAVVDRLREAPDSAILREGLCRRLQAMQTACSLLEYVAAAGAFSGLNDKLHACGRAVSPELLSDVSGALAAIPVLIQGSTAPGVPALAVPRLNADDAVPAASLPAPAVALCSDPRVRRELQVAWSTATMPDGRAFAGRLATTQDQALHLARTQAPEVVIVDFAHRDAASFIAALHDDTLTEPVRLIVLLDHPDTALPEAVSDFVACRALGKPCSAATLATTLTSICRTEQEALAHEEPWDGLTVSRLTELLCDELKQGLEQAVTATHADERFDLGTGAEAKAAVWSALAKVRQTVVKGSAGRVAFVDRDPTKGVPMLLAAEDNETEQRGESRSVSSVSLKGRTIIVVDDDPAIAWFLSGALRKAGANVIEAHHGPRALELVYQHWPDLVISDILMPELDGFALCRRLKSDLALSDTPVVLVSWKEDLLQRVRELGADADGYLRKEASAPTVVRRTCEVLRARARVEKRIAASTVVMGRLDGLTPRLVLDLVCRLRRDAKLTFSEASRTFIAHVEDGELTVVSSQCSDGRETRGTQALTELLGVRVARFEIGPAEPAGPRELSGSLHELVEPALVRARSLWRLFEPTRLKEVARVVIRPEGDIGTLPDHCQRAFRALHDGSAPTHLVGMYGGETVARLLGDLVRRGVIQAVHSVEGQDLLAREMARLRDRQDDLEAVPDFETPKPGDQLDVDGSRSELPPRVEPGLGLERESTRLGTATVSEVDYTRSARPGFQIAVEEPPEAPAHPRGLERAAAVAVGAQLPESSASAAVHVSAIAEDPEPSIDLGDALFSQVAGTPSAPLVQAAPVQAPARPVEERASRSARAPFVVEQPPPPPEPTESSRDSVAGWEDLLPTQESPRTYASAAPESLAELPLEAAPPAESAQLPSLEVTPEPESILPSAKPQRDDETGSRWSEFDPQPVAKPTVAARAQAAWALARGQGATLFQNLRGAATQRSVASAGRNLAGKVTQRAAPLAKKAKGAAGPLVLTIVAGSVAFGAVRWVTSTTHDTEAAAAVVASQEDVAEQANESPQLVQKTDDAVTEEPAAQQAVPVAAFTVSDMELPSDVSVGDGAGLLEISTGGSHKIYVGGVFVGAGPVRRVPVPAGTHEIQIRLDSVERGQQVAVPAGRRVRVTLNAVEAKHASR